MFCIAAFIIFAVLGIFSASYRSLAKKAWKCTLRKMTFRPCDINFQEEAKAKLLGKFIITRPRLARFLDRWIGVFASIFVILSVWSLLVVLNSGLNLLVYDTCNPNNAESCSLAGDACGVTSGKPGFWVSLKDGHIVAWTTDKVSTLGETITMIPNRFKEWNPSEFVSDSNTYYASYDSKKSTALEIIDPSCKFCAKLFNNIKDTNFTERYNLTYIVYPIPDSAKENGYRFPHSLLVASYLEAVKHHPLPSANVPADWQILERIFLGKDSDNVDYQIKFNTMYTEQEAENTIHTWLTDMGYSEEDILNIHDDIGSEEVQSSLARQREIVENRIQTIKIPTIMFDGRRYDRAIGPEKLTK